MWPVPKEWTGETAFLLGGGPSLSGFNADVLRGHGRVIGINESGLTLAPWADVLWWPDARWLEWNFDRLDLFVGRYRVTRQDPKIRTGSCKPQLKRAIEAALPALDVKVIDRDKIANLSFNSTRVSGICGGSNAINLAFHFGAKRIVLLGFDMRPNGHFHDNHKIPSLDSSYDRFAAAIKRMAIPLEQNGVEVLNATPGSALKCFPAVELGDLL